MPIDATPSPSAERSAEEPFPARRRVVNWFALLAIYWLALLAATHVPWQAARRIEHADKVGHFVAYAILAALLYAAGRMALRSRVALVAAVFMLIAAYATLDEWLQTFVPRRTADLYDWIADLAGASFALTLCVAGSRLPIAAWSRLLSRVFGRNSRS